MHKRRLSAYTAYRCEIYRLYKAGRGVLFCEEDAGIPACACGAGSLLCAGDKFRTYVSVQQEQVSRSLVVLDPGHGGRDPGKIGVNGEEEKDLNLAVALRTREVLKDHGIEVVMTREEDVMLGDADAQNRKAADMRERVKMINDLQPAIAVSIHQNSYTDSAVRGPQVFYYTHSEQSRQAAEIMRGELLEGGSGARPPCQGQRHVLSAEEDRGAGHYSRVRLPELP